MARRYYSSIAAQTTLSAGVDSSTATIPVTEVSGWPSSFPYTLLIDKDTVNEEIVSVTGRTGTTLTVTRGVDGSSGVAHSAGANVQHGVSARDFNEPNDFINGTGVVTTALIADSSVTSAKIADGTIVNADVNASAAIAQSKIASLTTDLAAKFPLTALSVAPTTVTYTLLSTDAGKIVEMNYASVLRTVTNVALTSNVATLTTSADHGFTVGSIVIVSNVTNNSSLFNGTYTVASVPTTTTFTYAKTNANIASAAATGTSPNVYETNQLIIPPNSGTGGVAFPIGTSIFVVQTGAGQTTITAGDGVTVNSFIGLKIIGQWAGCTLIKRATNTWVAVGGLVA